VRFLICTDVGARGIDISGLPYVINMTLPDKSEDYIHRSVMLSCLQHSISVVLQQIPPSCGERNCSVSLSCRKLLQCCSPFLHLHFALAVVNASRALACLVSPDANQPHMCVTSPLLEALQAGDRSCRRQRRCLSLCHPLCHSDLLLLASTCFLATNSG